MQKFFTVLEAY